MTAFGEYLTAWEAVRAVAPSPGVHMSRPVLLNAAQILCPQFRRASLSAALADAVRDHGERLVRVRRGVYTTRPAKTSGAAA